MLILPLVLFIRFALLPRCVCQGSVAGLVRKRTILQTNFVKTAHPHPRAIELSKEAQRNTYSVIDYVMQALRIGRSEALRGPRRRGIKRADPCGRTARISRFIRRAEVPSQPAASVFAEENIIVEVEQALVTEWNAPYTGANAFVPGSAVSSAQKRAIDNASTALRSRRKRRAVFVVVRSGDQGYTGAAATHSSPNRRVKVSA